ncbi:hypothetical protein [Bdellovibrio sp.]|uniref:hypothetical protein n=1 Tax=Bdellovibrio sp. TaxID=28201 RepID=UPI0039E38532
MELVFSFLLNTWKDFPEMSAWADEHLGGTHSLIEGIKEEEQIFCILEKNHLLSYDGRRKKQLKIKIPKECERSGLKMAAFDEIDFTSESLASQNYQGSWDQKVDVRIKGQKPFTLYVRQDKKYIGAHSTKGWSMWIERKAGHLRYEFVDQKRTTHFRLKAKGDLNPLKGGIAHLHELEALYVCRDGKKVQRALAIFGAASEGYRKVAYQRLGDSWTPSYEECSRKKSCKDPLRISLSEEKVEKFSDISSKSYLDFIERGQPLSFMKVEPEELVPPMSIFR